MNSSLFELNRREYLSRSQKISELSRVLNSRLEKKKDRRDRRGYVWRQQGVKWGINLAFLNAFLVTSKNTQLYFYFLRFYFIGHFSAETQGFV